MVLMLLTVDAREKRKRKKETHLFPDLPPSLYGFHFLVSDRIAALHLCAVTSPSGPYYCTYHHLPVATETTLGGFLHCPCMYALVCQCLYFSVYV